MRKTVKIILALMCACFVCISVPLSVSAAAEEYTEGFFIYCIKDQGVVIISYTGDERVVSIPDFIAGYPVSGIAEGAFTTCNAVEEIVLPGTIMTISEHAFRSAQTVRREGNQDELSTTGEDVQNTTSMSDTESPMSPGTAESDAEGRTTIGRQDMPQPAPNDSIPSDAEVLVIFPSEENLQGIVSNSLKADEQIENNEIDLMSGDPAPVFSEKPKYSIQAKTAAVVSVSAIIAAIFAWLIWKRNGTRN
ncbi:MAG: hypothetical protein ACI4TD_08000 [Phocaeicola sp.]